MTEIHYCANGCTRRHGDRSDRAQTEGKSQLCTQCEDRLQDWLKKIPDNYALVPLFIEHGTTDTNPESKATKGATAQAPMRLDAIDLLDTRRGRIWNGLAPATDRRGVIGVLQPWVDITREGRTLTSITTITVVSACQLLGRHLLWIAEQDWAVELYDDIKKLHRSLADAVGDYRQKPVGHCTLVPDGTDKPCGGALFPNKAGGVTCSTCRETWGQDRLRLLGLAISEPA
jgi:hypothetical protein